MIVPGSVNAHLLGGGLSIQLRVNADGYNIRTAAIAAGWDGVSPVEITVTNSGTYRALTTGGYALDTDVTYPVGSKIKIINTGSLVGKGGPGGSTGSGDSSGSSGTAPSGGPSVRLRSSCPWELLNSGNIIGGGGSGGWGGGKHDLSSDAYHGAYNGGAAGAGLVAGSAGLVTNTGGTISSGGVGGKGGNGSSAATVSGGGGGGGAGEGGYGPGNSYSAVGANGVSGTILAPGTGGAGAGSGSTAGASGGALGGGVAVSGNANITWASTGTRLGSIV